MGPGLITVGIVQHIAVCLLNVKAPDATQIRPRNVSRTKIAVERGGQKSRPRAAAQHGVDNVVADIGKQHIQQDKLGAEDIPQSRTLHIFGFNASVAGNARKPELPEEAGVEQFFLSLGSASYLNVVENRFPSFVGLFVNLIKALVGNL